MARGVVRLMGDLGRAALLEVPLANGRRADVMAVDAKGMVTIVEVKSCLADFQSDHKWEDYRSFCDVFFFAVPEDFPQDYIAGDCGLIIADRHGGDLLREGVPHPLSGARRKAILIRFARMAALRLTRLEDP
ncbi:MmcB family DNA repair protein [Rhodospirillum sp. A1_3_36]|uniref:MmcB family DNA repair protein n=1 Tax=Rhodospirillum sp. A1_3_36 TaxID=3391666 RepID=UPI0039A5D5EA